MMWPMLCSKSTEDTLRDRLECMVGAMARTYGMSELVPNAIRALNEIDKHVTRQEATREAERKIADKQQEEVETKYDKAYTSMHEEYKKRIEALEAVARCFRDLKVSKAEHEVRLARYQNLCAAIEELKHDFERRKAEVKEQIKKEVAAGYMAREKTIGVGGPNA